MHEWLKKAEFPWEAFQEIAEHLEEGMWLTEREGYLYASGSFLKIWDLPGPGVSISSRELLARVVEEDRGSVQELFESPTRHQQRIQFRIRRSDGKIRLLRATAFPVRNRENGTVRVMGIANDITEQEAFERELREAQPLGVLATMAASAAHDFNNILTVVQNCAFLLRCGLHSRAEQGEILGSIERAVERANSLTRRLVAFNQKQNSVKKTADLNEMVSGMMGMLVKLLRKGVRLSFQGSGTLLPIKVDRAMFEHAIVNLITNARDAIPGEGTISIKAFEAAEEGASTEQEQLASLSIEDSGTGMSPEVLAKIFEPFFTTKPAGKGTGLGLAAVDRFVKEEGAMIEVASEPGRGTIFTLTFPLVTDPVEKGCDRCEETDFFCKDERMLLLVGKDDATRRAVKRVLIAAGYNVVDCRSAGRARHFWSSLKEEIGLVLTDLILADDISGSELLAEMRSENPGLPAIFMSGDPAGIMEDDWNKAFTRPVAPEVLLQTVKQLLKGTGHSEAPARFGGAASSHKLTASICEQRSCAS